MNNKPIKKKEIFDILKGIKIKNLISEKIDVINSEGRFLTNNIQSLINLPPFRNSAVDGYAIRDKDAELEKELSIKHRIVAGDDHQVNLLEEEVARIFTGAKMPQNSKTVVMQENVTLNNNKIKINKKPFVGENCRLAGEDIIKNQIIMKAGEKITTKNISLLAAIGKHSIEVKERISVGYFTSGNELLNPSETLIGSQINNSNQYALHSLLNKTYIDSRYHGVLKDSKEIVADSLLKNLDKNSVILTAGGASVGEEDYLVDAIKSNGELFFWQIAIKPGRPLAIGKINETIIICLPGNPVSVYLLFGMIIKPFLEFLCSSKMMMPNHYIAKANFSMKKKTERLEWLRVVIDKTIDSETYVNKYLKQGSGIISSISFSDGIIEIPENVNKIEVGDKFKLYLFSELFN